MVREDKDLVRRTNGWRWPGRGHAVLAACAACSALVLLAAAVMWQLNGNIRTQVLGEFGARPGASRPGVLNILTLGSQTRDGQGRGFGTDPGTDLSDTARLIHLDAAHAHAIVVSIPRDLVAYRPACRARAGPGVEDLFSWIRYSARLICGGRV